MTKQIDAFRSAVDAGRGIALDAQAALELWRELRDNDVGLIYADYQGKRTWKEEYKRVRTELDELKASRVEPSPERLVALVRKARHDGWYEEDPKWAEVEAELEKFPPNRGR